MRMDIYARMCNGQNMKQKEWRDIGSIVLILEMNIIIIIIIIIITFMSEFISFLTYDANRIYLPLLLLPDQVLCEHKNWWLFVNFDEFKACVDTTEALETFQLTRSGLAIIRQEKCYLSIMQPVMVYFFENIHDIKHVEFFLEGRDIEVRYLPIGFFAPASGNTV